MQRPEATNDFLCEHAALLISSFQRWTGRRLVSDGPPAEQARELFEAEFAVVSHDTAADPVFNYANRTALRLFECTWADFTRLPSRMSAEPVNRQERSRLLAAVTRDGFIEDYRGVRISASGQRFLIRSATVWNVVDRVGVYHGQAARFDDWTYQQPRGPA
jgi:hypothetical protein